MEITMNSFVKWLASKNTDIARKCLKRIVYKNDIFLVLPADGEPVIASVKGKAPKFILDQFELFKKESTTPRLKAGACEDNS